MKCRRCQKESPLISQVIGYCVDCIRSHFDEIEHDVREVHERNRMRDGLPPEPPRVSDVSLKINNMISIEKRGKELLAQHPELEDDINAYIQLQAEECDVINNQIEGALWLLKKTMKRNGSGVEISC